MEVARSARSVRAKHWNWNWKMRVRKGVPDEILRVKVQGLKSIWVCNRTGHRGGGAPSIHHKLGLSDPLLRASAFLYFTDDILAWWVKINGREVTGW